MSSAVHELARVQAADQVGLALFRTMILPNGGAILALPTFVGDASEDAAIVFSATTLKISMACFLVGIISMLVAVIVSYLFYANPPESGIHQFLNRCMALINGSSAQVSVTAFASGVSVLMSGAGPNQ